MFDLPPGSTLPAFLRILSFASFSFNPGQVADWAQRLKTRKILHLGFDNIPEVCSLVDQLSGSVSNLRSFAIRGPAPANRDFNPGIIKSLDLFLRQITKLHSFEAYDWPKDVLRSVGLYHGNHLRQLRFHHSGFAFRCPPGLNGSRFDICRDARALSRLLISLLSPEELTCLSSELPFVERLGIDLCFIGSMPCDILSGVASFENLKALELLTPDGVGFVPKNAKPDMPPFPWLDASITEEAFRYVAAQKVLQHRPAANNHSMPSWPQLIQLDITADCWGLTSVKYRVERLLDGFLPVSWWDPRSSMNVRSIQVYPNTKKLSKFAGFTEDTVYEMPMYSSGLWDSRNADFEMSAW
ncbi:hypothetical protein P170DRAFT_479087 [Aspergillus steynii IBT 23096]|uniref:Uncharacterized protein n=1 Tax=Aspergillus steynii IBT 23096 TaxID=1392250 RepID=A0A2I2G014_9EURO|nr:uncharacterized protein P170DRAFT_479087 [Aspergillus steynii IBT 23096]PLB46166.1 hypothetical protein P170DRAFT_479087 [Aspergillus steynii IBT 23096]